VLAQLRKIVCENLFIQLHDFSDKNVVKSVERQNWVLGHKVAKCDKRHKWIFHVHEKHSCHVRHPLNVANIWPVHSERLKYLLEAIGDFRRFKIRKAAKSARDIGVYYQN